MTRQPFVDGPTSMRDTTGLTQTVIQWINLHIALVVLWVFWQAFFSVDLATYGALTEGIEIPPWIGPLIVVARALVFVIAAILSLVWIDRSSRNAHQILRDGDAPPAWTMGWYFAPITDIRRPLTALNELWQLSAEPNGWRSRPAPRVLAWWWGQFLLSNVLISGVAAAIPHLQEPINPLFYLGIGGIYLLGGAMAVVADLLFIQIISDVSQNQRALMR